MLLVHQPETYVLNFSFKAIQYFLRILKPTQRLKDHLADVINVRFFLGQRLGITIVGVEEAPPLLKVLIGDSVLAS